MEHRGLLLAACIVLTVVTTAVHGLKCVECGPKPPLIQQLTNMQTDPRDVDLSTGQGWKINPACPASLPATTQCAATEKFCIKAEGGGQTSRFCYDQPLTGCKGDSCSYTCESDGCNSAEPVASKGKVLLIIMATLSLVPLFKF